MRTSLRIGLTVLLVVVIGIATGCGYKQVVLEKIPLPEESHPTVAFARSVALSSLKSNVMKSPYPVVHDVVPCNGTVVFSTGTGKIIPNDSESATVNRVAAWDTKTAKTDILATIHNDSTHSNNTKDWLKIVDLQTNNDWVLVTVLRNPGEIPSECYAFNRTTNKLTQLLQNYSWPAEDINKNTVVMPIFNRMLLQDNDAYLVVTRETMSTGANSGVSFSSLAGTTIIRVNLTTGTIQTIFESKLGSFSIYAAWALDHKSVAFSSSSVMNDGDTKDELLIYSPATGMSEPLTICQSKDAADPNLIDTYAITPDKGIIYASGEKIVMAHVTTPKAIVATTAIRKVHNYISAYILASDDYLVAKTEAGNIFLVNRHTGEGATIMGAGATGDFALKGNEIAFVRRTEGFNDSIVYLNLDENGFNQVGGPAQSSVDYQSDTSAAEQVVRQYFTYWNEKNVPEMEKRLTPDRRGVTWNFSNLIEVKLQHITGRTPIEDNEREFVVIYHMKLKKAPKYGLTDDTYTYEYLLKRDSVDSSWLIYDWQECGE